MLFDVDTLDDKQLLAAAAEVLGYTRESPNINGFQMGECWWHRGRNGDPKDPNPGASASVLHLGPNLSWEALNNLAGSGKVSLSHTLQGWRVKYKAAQGGIAVKQRDDRKHHAIARVLVAARLGDWDSKEGIWQVELSPTLGIF